jgi:hypothetical protein
MTGEPMQPDRDDAEHDAWLRAALRHAPDAAAGAPPALREAILREAAQKARAGGARPGRPVRAAWWAQAWSWLARPSVGAAFAGIVVATTVGLLWHGEPLPEAPRPEARVRVDPAPAVAPGGQEAAPQAQAPAQPATPPAAHEDAPPAAATSPRAKLKAETVPRPRANVAAGAKTEPAQAAQARRRAAAPPASAGMSGEAAATTAAAAPSPAAPSAAAVAPATAAPTAVTAAPPVATAAPPAATAEPPAATAAPPAATAAPPAAEPAAPRTKTPAPAPAPVGPRATAPAPPPVVTADALAPHAGVLSRAPLRGQFAAAAPVFSAAQIRAAIAADPAAWTWQRAGGPAQPVNDTLAAWLARLDATAGGRWLRAGLADDGPDDLLLLHDGHVAHRVRIDSSRMRWDAVQADGTTQRWQAPLAPDDARALQAQLDEATR